MFQVDILFGGVTTQPTVALRGIKLCQLGAKKNR